MIPRKGWSPQIIVLPHARPSTDWADRAYRCVSIKYCADGACDLVQNLTPQLCLSCKPPQFLETEKRFLIWEAPLLPLPECPVNGCRCYYVHHEDRRAREQRYFHDQPMAFAPVFVVRERRSEVDRRKLNSISPVNHSITIHSPKAASNRIASQH